MKNNRQTMILEIISQENIETQEQLLQRLQDRGIVSTQATISRDIKQMHLIKEPVGQGVYKYAVSGNRTKLNFAEKVVNGQAAVIADEQGIHDMKQRAKAKAALKIKKIDNIDSM